MDINPTKEVRVTTVNVITKREMMCLVTEYALKSMPKPAAKKEALVNDKKMRLSSPKYHGHGGS